MEPFLLDQHLSLTEVSFGAIFWKFIESVILFISLISVNRNAAVVTVAIDE